MRHITPADVKITISVKIKSAVKFFYLPRLLTLQEKINREAQSSDTATWGGSWERKSRVGAG